MTRSSYSAACVLQRDSRVISDGIQTSIARLQRLKGSRAELPEKAARHSKAGVANKLLAPVLIASGNSRFCSKATRFEEQFGKTVFYVW